MRVFVELLPGDRRLRSNTILGLAAALALASIADSAQAADAVATENASRSSSATAASGARVFSKEKPLFEVERPIPRATPDGSGNTRVEIILEPKPAADPKTQPDPYAAPKATAKGDAPPTGEKKDASAKPPSPTRAPVPNLLNKPKIVRETAQEEQVAERQAVPDLPIRNGRRSSEVADGERSGEIAASGVVLPTAKPRLRSGGIAPKPAQPPAKRKVPLHATRAAALAEKRRRRIRKHRRLARRQTFRRYRQWRNRRVPYWHRHAPPGTVDSYVRCLPGEPCIRYYRVRRPRTLRQYRRLLAWQRRQDARLRYRRYHRRY